MLAFLRSFWSEPQVADAPRRVWRDWVLVVTLTVVAVVEVVVRPDIPLRWLSFAAAIVGIPALPWRRTQPLVVTCVVFGATIAMDIPWIIRGGEPPGLYTNVYVLLVAYSLFRWGSGRQALAGLGVMLVPATLSVTLDYTELSEAITGFALFFACLVLGVAVRDRARARISKIDAIRAREREGLARELHDTVAHHVSAIAIRAQAGLATAPGDPAAAGEALRVIEAEASRALAEMRTIVRVLRDDDPADLAPAPDIADIAGLAQSPAAGPPVEVTIDGDLDAVLSAVSTAVYRLAQEAITNARRHARDATRIEVAVTADPNSVHLRVHDDGAPAVLGEHGYGLVGMAERAALMGGTCQAGPDPIAGWTVTAVLPRNGAPA